MSALGLKVGLILILATSQIEAACKAHDAAWERGVKPRVSQPSRLHPEKVELDWTTAIYNARCVDFYNIYVWKYGQTQDRGQKIVVMNNTVSKQELIIEPCVDYNFAVEFVERDWTHTDTKASEPVKFKTEAIPALNSQNPKDFQVTLATDKIKRHQLVDRVSIKFNKNVIKHASCIKHVEINGVVDTQRPIGGSTQSNGRAMGFGQRVVGAGRSVGGSSTYNPGQHHVGGSSTYNPGQHQVGGSSTYNPSQNQVGGSSTYNPGQVGGSSTYNPGRVGGSSTYNPGQQVGGSSLGWSWSHGGQSGQHIVMPDNYGYSR